jgi:dihydrofolate synthase/folylpolyglutamate synthase
MIDSMLGVCGVMSGLFTSPHLVRPNERIRLAGSDIQDGELHRRLAEMRDIIERGLADARLEVHPSFFEVITATALRAFADHGMRAAVLEVGLGGRLDATNAVEADVAVIVSIGLDHTKTLGPTLERIAHEKAGIIKPGRPVVSGATQPEVVEILQRVCRERGADYIDARDAARLTGKNGEHFTLETAANRYPELRCALAGSHQADNARIAVAALERLMDRLGTRPDPDAVREGLASVRWAGRLQWIEPGDGLPRMLLDGAHNPPGIAALESYLAGLEPPLPVLLVGATSGKPLRELLGPLAPHVDGVVITRPPVERGLEPDAVANEVGSLFGSVEAVREPARALERACEMAGDRRPVLVTGSIYLVGEILSLLSSETVPGPVAM